MNRSFILRTILPLFLFGSIQGVTGQESVSLYLKPDPSSFKVTTLPADDSRLAAGVEMPYDANQANIWKWLELNQTFEGHVRKTYVTKGLSIQVGAPVYFIPGDEDAFLTILEDSANAEVIESVGDWVKISINASLPVYFETNTAAPLPVVEEPQAFPSRVDNTSVEAESAVAFDEPVSYEPTDLGITNAYPGEPIDRILEGKLVQYKPTFSNPFRKPTYKWEILNRRKKRVAFIDPANLILDRPLESYEGDVVSFTGSIYQINKGRDLVMVVNQITPL